MSSQTASDTAGAERVAAIVAALHRLYPDADCELRHDDPLQLLIATILSAQSTDARVNQVTVGLFEKYRSAEDFAAADPEELEREIHSTGFYRNKAKALIGTGSLLVSDHGGEVPQDLEALVALPGVARKTANVVLGTAFGKPEGVVVDTHVKRLSYRLALSDEKAPEKVERDLMELLPRSEWIFVAHALILHGRRVCQAKKPLCGSCDLAPICPQRGVSVSA